MADDLVSIFADPARRAKLPAGMRNNNPGNIKWVGQRVPGIVGPSVNTDQGDPQAVFASPEAGMAAMYRLLEKKYRGGKTTPLAIIAGNGGWTPGNQQAAINVARTAGLDPNGDIGFGNPDAAVRFMRALITQEHGSAGSLYSPEMIRSAVSGSFQSAAPGAPLGAALASSQRPTPAKGFERSAASPLQGGAPRPEPAAAPPVFDAPFAPAPPSPSSILAALFLQNQQAAQQRKQEERAAEEARRAALFASADPFSA